MKKTKLITTLSTIAVAGASVPVVATSCSKNEEYKIESIEWLTTPQVDKTTAVYNCKITKGGKEISNDLIKEVVNNNSSEELGVYSKDPTIITPTKSGDWDYKVKVTFYKDDTKKETEDTNLSTKVTVIEDKPVTNVYKLESITWSTKPEETVESYVADFKLTKNGSQCPIELIKSYVNDGSSTELGVDGTNPLKIIPTKAGSWDYKLKVTFYKDDTKEETEDANLSIKVEVASKSEPQEVKSIVNDNNVTIPYAMATAETTKEDVVGKLGVKLLNENVKEISQEGKTISYSIDLTNKPEWLINSTVNSNGDVSLEIDNTKITEKINAFNTTWTATCDGVTSEPIDINLWCTPKLEKNGMIVCDEAYKSYHVISLPEKIVRQDMLALANVKENKVTFKDAEGQSQTVDVKTIVYLSIVNVETKEQNKNVYMVYDDFCRGWENLCYVDFSGLVDIEAVGQYAFEGCTNLLEIDMSGAKKLNLFYKGALSNCTSLQSIDFSDVGQETTKRQIMEADVLSGCTSLKTINLSGFTDGSLFYDGFAYNCPNLEEIIIGNQDPSSWWFKYGKDYILANMDPNCPAYKNGIKISGNGSNEAKFKEALPENTEEGSLKLRKYQ